MKVKASREQIESLQALSPRGFLSSLRVVVLFATYYLVLSLPEALCKDCGPMNEPLKALMSCAARTRGMQELDLFADVFQHDGGELRSPIRHYSIKCRQRETWDRERLGFYATPARVVCLDGLVLGSRHGDLIKDFQAGKMGTLVAEESS